MLLNFRLMLMSFMRDFRKQKLYRITDDFIMTQNNYYSNIHQRQTAIRALVRSNVFISIIMSY